LVFYHDKFSLSWSLTKILTGKAYGQTKCDALWEAEFKLKKKKFSIFILTPETHGTSREKKSDPAAACTRKRQPE